MEYSHIYRDCFHQGPCGLHPGKAIQGSKITLVPPLGLGWGDRGGGEWSRVSLGLMSVHRALPLGVSLFGRDLAVGASCGPGPDPIWRRGPRLQVSLYEGGSHIESSNIEWGLQQACPKIYIYIYIFINGLVPAILAQELGVF